MEGSGSEIVIVGAGVMGLSIAYYLAAADVHPLVLERRYPGAGSTGKSGAILRQHYSLELTAEMARDSLQAYSEFPERVGGSAGFVRTGMALIVNARDRDGLTANIELQRSLRIETELLDARGLREAIPGAVIEQDAVGCFEPNAGYANPIGTLASLSAAVRRLGGTIRTGVAVDELLEDGDRIRGVVADDAELAADTVVVAAGPWSSTLMSTVGWAAEVTPMRVQSAVFRRPPEMTGGPVLIDFVNEYYAKHAEETHVGSLAASEAVAAGPDDYDEGVTHDYVKLARERLSSRLPDMERAISFGGYGALYAVTPDWHPVIGPAGPEGLYLCAGFSGHGFKLAPSVGASVAAELLGRMPDHDLGPLRPDRFARGHEVSGRYAYSIIG